VLRYYFSLNGVICYVTDWASAKIVRWLHCNVDNCKTLKTNYMLIRLLYYAYRMAKYKGKILLLEIPSDC